MRTNSNNEKSFSKSCYFESNILPLLKNVCISLQHKLAGTAYSF